MHTSTDEMTGPITHTINGVEVMEVDGWYRLADVALALGLKGGNTGGPTKQAKGHTKKAKVNGTGRTFVWVDREGLMMIATVKGSHNRDERRALLEWLGEDVTLPVKHEQSGVARVRREPQAAEGVGYEVIPWETFAYNQGGIRGISLRALVAASLYAHIETAVAALSRLLEGQEISRPSIVPHGPQGVDHILTLEDAMYLCGRAQTRVGARILRLMITHSRDFQRLLAGDEEVKAKVEEHQQASAALDDLSPTLRMMIEGERRMNQMQAQIESVRTEALGVVEERLSTRGGSETSLMELAHAVGLTSKTGRPHGQAMGALVRAAGGEAAGYLRPGTHISPDGEHREGVWCTAQCWAHVLAITEEADQRALRIVGADRLQVTVRGHDRNYTAFLDAAARDARIKARKLGGQSNG